MNDIFTLNYENIKKNIKSPEISSNVFEFDCNQHDSDNNFVLLLNRKISEISNSGGGKIVIPPGNYYSRGPIILKSNIELFFENHSTVIFSDNPNDYLVGSNEFAGCVLTSFEGTFCYNYSPLIYANSCNNILITGNVTFDAQGGKSWAHFRDKQSVDRLNSQNQNNNNVPLEQRIYGAGHFLRPSFIYFYNCNYVKISDVKFTNSAFWNLHPVLCSNIKITNVSFDMNYKRQKDYKRIPEISNIYFKNIHFGKITENAILINGLEESNPENIYFSNIVVDGFNPGNEILNADVTFN